jgi:hypothetical protein
MFVIAACLALAACGTSSTEPTATSSTSASASVTQGRSAIIACLTKAGIAPPARPAGSATPASRQGAPRGAGPDPGAGNPKVTAALQKCGITSASRGAAKHPTG